MRKISSLVLALVALVSFSIPAFAVRTTVTAVSPVSLRGTISAGAATLTMTACDATNFNDVTSTGREYLLVQNTHATTAYTVTITSAADSLGRTGDITTYSLAAGEIALFGPFKTAGWKQSDGKLRFAASNASVKVCVIRVPAGQ